MDSRVIHGEDAKTLLENSLFKLAFAKVGEYLESQALGCDPDNKDKAARIIIAKQLLIGIRREIEAVISDGEVARVQMSELEKKKRFSVFQR